jgi:hypothetical protein
MKNDFNYRYFLFLNYLSNRTIGMVFLNFAELIKSEREGRYMNSQMTSYFFMFDEVFSDLIGNDTLWIFDELDLNELAEIPAEQLKNDYITYCVDEEEFIKFKIP